MSVIAYVGVPGSGKTITAVEHQILPALRAGRHVVTNVAMDWDAVRELGLPGVLDELPTELIVAEPARIHEFALPGTIVVLDEVWRILPAGVKSNKVPEEIRAWFAEHRHKKDAQGNTSQIVLVTQDLAQVSAFARGLVEQTFRIVKMSHLGASNHYRIDVFNGPVVGPNPPMSNRLRTIPGRYNRKMFRLYRSHTQAEGEGGAVNEKSLDRRMVVWRSPAFVIGAPLTLAVLAWGAWSMWSWYAERAAPASARAGGASAAAPARATPAPRGQAPTPTAAEVQPYRVVGFVSGGGNGRAAIRAAEGLVLYVDGSSCWEPGDGLTHCMFDGVEVTEVWARRRVVPVEAAADAR